MHGVEPSGSTHCPTVSDLSYQGRGEQVARSLFPETTLVRPAPIFGFEDNLLLQLAKATNLLTSNNMQQKFWPVHVSSQYADAFINALY